MRRLELHKLEQQCWRYLIAVLDASTNCEYLHDLADKYGCPPLKLAAWKLMKEKALPGLASFPTKQQLVKDAVKDSDKALRGTGLTGPGDPLFSSIVAAKYNAAGIHPVGMDKDTILPSLFDDYEDEWAAEGDEGSVSTRDRHFRVLSVEELTDRSSATEVIMAWAQRLKSMYLFMHSLTVISAVYCNSLLIAWSRPALRCIYAVRACRSHRQSGD